MAFRLPCQAVSDIVATLPRTLGIIDAKIPEDAVWTLPQISPAGSLANSVIPGEILIIRNITAQNLLLVSHPLDNIDGFRDVTIPSESSLIMTAAGGSTWSILVSAQIQMLTSNSSGTTASTGTNSGDATADAGNTASGQDTSADTGNTATQAASADRRANMPMTKVHGLVKKV